MVRDWFPGAEFKWEPVGTGQPSSHEGVSRPAPWLAGANFQSGERIPSAGARLIKLEKSRPGDGAARA
jgi:hypothetical protein